MIHDVLADSLFPPWHALSSLQRQKLRHCMRTHSYESGTQICLTLAEEEMWYLSKGRLSIVMQAEDGRQIRLFGLVEGEIGFLRIFGSQSIPQIGSIDAVVEEDAILHIIPSPTEDMLPPGMLYRLERAWMDRLLPHLTGLIGQLAFSPLSDRLRAQLREHAKQQQTEEISITHEKLAAELGTSREVISRLLTQMARAGHVELHRKRIRLIP